MYIVADIEKIKRCFKKVFKKYNIECEILSCNNYRAILIENEYYGDDEKGLYIWIRLLNVKDTALYNIDIANIYLPKELRRKGILTSIYKELQSCKYVNKIRFISVCTYEMRQWCNKFNLKSFNDGSDYTN